MILMRFLPLFFMLAAAIPTDNENCNECDIPHQNEISHKPIKYNNTHYNKSCMLHSHCDDPRMVCRNPRFPFQTNDSAKKFCLCARFYDPEQGTKQCLPNITKIIQWFKHQSVDEEFESKAEDFGVIQTDPYILKAKWRDYEYNDKWGFLDFLKTTWPIFVVVAGIIGLYTFIYAIR